MIHIFLSKLTTSFLRTHLAYNCDYGSYFLIKADDYVCTDTSNRIIFVTMNENLTTNTNKAAEVCHTGAPVPENMIFMHTHISNTNNTNKISNYNNNYDNIMPTVVTIWSPGCHKGVTELHQISQNGSKCHKRRQMSQNGAKCYKMVPSVK